MKPSEIDAIRWRLANVEDSINGNFPWDCRALLGHIDAMAAVIAAVKKYMDNLGLHHYLRCTARYASRINCDCGCVELCDALAKLNAP